MGKQEMKRNISVGSLNPTGLEGEYTEKCNQCERAVYLSDSFPFDIDEILCIDCVSKVKNPEIQVADETARRLGVPKKELIEAAKDIIEYKKRQRIGIGG